MPKVKTNAKGGGFFGDKMNQATAAMKSASDKSRDMGSKMGDGYRSMSSNVRDYSNRQTDKLGSMGTDMAARASDKYGERSRAMVDGALGKSREFGSNMRDGYRAMGSNIRDFSNRQSDKANAYGADLINRGMNKFNDSKYNKMTNDALNTGFRGLNSAVGAYDKSKEQFTNAAINGNNLANKAAYSFGSKVVGPTRNALSARTGGKYNQTHRKRGRRNTKRKHSTKRKNHTNKKSYK